MRHLSQALPSLAVAALLALAIGCGGRGTGSRIFTEQQIVTPAGGVYQYRGGLVSLTLAANAVTTNTPISIQSPPSVAVPVDNMVMPDTTYQFTTMTLPSSASVAISYDPSDLPSGALETELRLVRLTAGAWVNQTATLDAVNDRLTVSTTTLGVFAIRINRASTSGSTNATSATTATTATTASAAVTAEAGLDDSGAPAVFVSWTPSAFGSFTKERWQVYRNDVSTTPVGVATASTDELEDDAAERSLTWSDFGGAVGGDACANRTPGNASAAGVPGVAAGRPYQYSVQSIYSRAESELPAGGTSTARCYFASSRQNSSTATALVRPVPTTPADGTPISGSVTFTFESVSNGSFTGEYVIQVSNSATFATSTTVANLETSATGTISTSPINLSAVSPAATTLFWRLGARNAADNPGPVEDALTGDRYIFSAARTLTR